MRFKGSAPEIVNCRLAMLGFVAAVAAGGFLNDFMDRRLWVHSACCCDFLGFSVSMYE